jgi:hypothetical protein
VELVRFFDYLFFSWGLQNHFYILWGQFKSDIF